MDENSTGAHSAVTGPALCVEGACSHCQRNYPSDELVKLHDHLFCIECKPWALQRLQEGLAIGCDPAQIRGQHINHETKLRIVGRSHIVSGSLILLVGVVSAPTEPYPKALVYTLLGASELWVGLSLKNLNPASRIAAGVISCLGLLGGLLGTFFNSFVLYLLISSKSSTVFSNQYKDVIAKSGHIKSSIPRLAWILFGLVAFLCIRAGFLPLLRYLAY